MRASTTASGALARRRAASPIRQGVGPLVLRGLDPGERSASLRRERKQLGAAVARILLVGTEAFGNEHVANPPDALVCTGSITRPNKVFNASTGANSNRPYSLTTRR
jgi:hypothetical protein